MNLLRMSFLVMAVLAVGAGGCNVAGPQAVRTGRVDYNIAVQQTNVEQMLLNLVRLKYRDTPYFMEVASISTSFDFRASASSSLSIPESAGNVYGLGGAVSFDEKPTITYMPLQGDKFVKQVMSPIDTETMLLLCHSGWSIDRTFRICLQSINGVRNMPSASGPAPEAAGEYADFLKVCKLLRALQVRGDLVMGRCKLPGSNDLCVEVRIVGDAMESDEVKQLQGLLHLADEANSFPITTEIYGGQSDRLAVVPRSLIACFFYVSQSVEAPVKDEDAGRVTITRGDNGRRFDWQELLGGLIRIQSAAHRPENAYAAVKYRSSWFYIDDSDLTAKSTFALLMQLFALQAGEIKSTGPILTLPVGG